VINNRVVFKSLLEMLTVVNIDTDKPGMPGGASLYSLSVAWVSSFGALAPKRGLCVVVRLCSVCCQATIKLLRIS